MKKLIYGSLFLAVVGITVYSCKKEELNKTSGKRSSISERITTDGKVLIFETLNDYETLIDAETPLSQKEELIKHIQTLKFENYLSNYNNQQKSGESEIQEMDEELGQMLNEDGVIQIGSYLYKINLANESVFRLPALLYLTHYETLVDELIENTPVEKYSIDDDVLHPKSSDCGGVDGGIYRCYANSYDGQIIKTFPDGSVWRLNPFVRFFKAGVWFKLSSQFEIWRYPSSSHQTGGQIAPSNITQSGLSIEMFIRSPQGWWKKRPCNSSSVGTKSSGYHYTEATYSTGKVSVYTGTRNLNGYYFYVQGRAKYTDGTVTIASPYGGRNINSPY